MLRFFLIFSCLFLVANQLSSAQEQEITQAWLIRQKLKSDKDPVVENQLQTILSLQKKHGLQSLPSISNLLLQESLDDIPSVSEKKIEYARLFSNDSSLVDHFECNTKISFASFGSCYEALKKDLNSSEGRLRVHSNVSTVLLGGFFIFSVAFAFLLIIQHWKTSTMYFSYRFPHFPPWGFDLLGAAFVFTCYLGLGCLGALYGLIFLFSRHLHAQEKIIVSVVLIMLSACPMLFRWYAYKANYDLGISHILESPFEDFDVGNKVAKLENHLKVHPQDAYAVFTLARLNHKLNNGTKAMELFQRTSSIQPKWHKPWVDEAILHHGNKETDKAIESLKKAIELNASSVYAHFNLGKLLIQETRLEEAQMELKKAKEIDPELFEALERESKLNPQNILIEEGLSEAELFDLTHPVFSSSVSEFENAMFQNYFSPMSRDSFYVLNLALLLLPWLLQKFFPVSKSFLQITSKKNPVANQHIDILNPISAKSALGSFGFIASLWTKMKEGWLTFLIPTGHFYLQGSYALSVALLSILSLTLAPLLTNHLLLENVQTFSVRSFSPITYLSLLVFVLIYSILGYSTIRESYGT